MPAWPDALPLCPLDDGYTESQEQNIAEFASEVGPPLRRRRSSIATSLIQFSLILDDDELDALETFFKDDCKDGALAFTRPHPRKTSIEGSFIFVTPPTITRAAPFWKAAISLRSMP